jgi:magnesium-protoporphyrin O-methyltransferase
MTCAHCVGSEKFFDEKRARSDVKRYRRRGPDRSSQLLIDLLLEAGVRERSVLDVGGGVGALQHELLRQGAREVLNVDASPAYQEVNRGLAAERGLADRITYRSGDFVELASALPAADVVSLDRVICCYPNMPALVDASAAHARRLYGFVAPRERGLTRLGIRLANLFFRLRGNPFRVFVHSLEAIDGRLRRQGLQPRRARRTFLWEVRVYERPLPAPV